LAEKTFKTPGPESVPETDQVKTSKTPENVIAIDLEKAALLIQAVEAQRPA
jgi:hypothetical protein